MSFCLEIIVAPKCTVSHVFLFAFESWNKWISIDHEIIQTIGELNFLTLPVNSRQFHLKMLFC